MRLIASLLLSACLMPLAHASEPDCTGLVGRKLAGAVVVSATWVVPGTAPAQALPGQATPLVPFCRVSGTIERTIGFEVWLPQRSRWNRRLLGAGVGGSAGTLNWHAMADGVDRGFAAASTDTGHRLDQAGWMLDRRAAENYADRGVHLMTVAAKAITARYYSQAVRHAYFEGCSGGGREALKEMQRFPRDYAGILAGAPGSNMPLLSVRHMLVGLWQEAAAVKLQPADWQLMSARVIAACDGLDGVRDGIMEDPRRCHFDLQSLRCRPGQERGCLSIQKLALMQRIVGPIRTSGGTSVDDGLLPGVTARPGPPPSLLLELFGQGVHHDAHWNEQAFDPDRDLAAVYAQLPGFRADDPDLRAFRDAGGKAILYQGWMDPSVLAQATIAYYQAVAARMGGLPATGRFVRLFMVPGMLHCGGGAGTDRFGGEAGRVQDDPGHDALSALIQWVEAGRPPSDLVAARVEQQRVVRTRLLCAFPGQAHYLGRGNADDAANFSCGPAALVPP